MHSCKYCGESFATRRVYEGHLSAPGKRCPRFRNPVVSKSPRAVQVPNEDEAALLPQTAPSQTEKGVDCENCA